ncbi:MAG: 4Fe-4S dicluster domain-containing protein [Negativicutes bacterium]
MMKLPPLRIWRTLVPSAALLATVALVASFTFPLPAYTEILLWYSRLDPLLLLSHLRNGTFPAWGWLPVVSIVLTLAVGRVFCGWLCPLGGLLAVIQSLKFSGLKATGLARQGGSPPRWINKLDAYRYPWLLFLMALMLFGSGWTLYFTPFHLLTEELSRIWQSQIPWILLLVIFLGLAVFPRFWCVYVCPTGLLLSFISRWRLFRVKPPASCVHCGICRTVCPTGAADPDLALTTSDCLLCGRCSEKCPAELFDIVRHQKTDIASMSAGNTFTRREVLRSGTALVIAGAVAPALSRPAGANPLRPPGALDEDEFLSRCSRCGRCIKVCPSKCIQSMPLSSGPALFLTPYIVARDARCELTQHCQQVCPTGAIAHVPISNVMMGLAEIDQSRCLGWAQGKLCLLCQEQCPQHAIDSDDKDRPSVRTELCVGCGACENGCPLEPASIVVKPQPRRRRK